MMTLKNPMASTLELLLFFLMFPAASLFGTFKKVKLREAASLPCYQQCPGLVTWKHKGEVLAQCDQTSCSSKEGFQMIHDEYLKGNLSLVIPEADFSKRMWYTCQCDGKHLCDVSLQIEPFSYPVDVLAGEPFTLDLPIPDDVEITFNGTNDTSPETSRLCRIEGLKAQCVSKYEKKVRFGCSLQLKDVKNHDGGIYIVRDIKNDEVIGMYTVTVREGPPTQDGWSVALGLGVILGFAVLVIVVLGVKYLQLQKSLRCHEDGARGQISMTETGQQVEPQDLTGSEPEIITHSPVMETDDGQEIMEQKKLQEDSETSADAAGESYPLLEMNTPVDPASVSDEPPLSHPVPDSSTEYPADTVFE